MSSPNEQSNLQWFSGWLTGKADEALRHQWLCEERLWGNDRPMYHGGVNAASAGLSVGSILLPANLLPKGNRGLDGIVTKDDSWIRDYVYVSPWLNYAAFMTYSHTKHHPGEHGSIYRVKALGDITPVGHAPDHLFKCSKAEVVEVLPFKYLKDEEIGQVLRVHFGRDL